MSNTINVNYMTRAYNQYQQKNAAKDQEKEDTRFADSVREKSEASGSIVGNSKIGSVSAKDMTMVEYKQYIYNKISQIPMHPTRAGESISVTISEAGFEAMKNDPEYEAWVLNDLQVGWSQPDKWSGICGGAFSTIYYGASKEECHAEMWSAGYNNGNGGKIFNDKSKNSFWERPVSILKDYRSYRLDTVLPYGNDAGRNLYCIDPEDSCPGEKCGIRTGCLPGRRLTADRSHTAYGTGSYGCLQLHPQAVRCREKFRKRGSISCQKN